MKKVWSGVRVGVGGLLLVAALGLMAGCGSGSGSSGGGTTAVGAATGTVTGQVVSAAGNAPVAGATVSTTAGTATSAADGSFTLPAPAGDRAVIHVEATGFAEAFPVTRVVSGQTITIGVKLLPVGVTATLTVANGGTVTVPNSTAQVELPPNGLVPKTGGTAAGTVTISVTPVNPAVDPNLMPGDFNGVTVGGGTTAIESFGAMLVDIRDNAGTRYTLAPGQTSTIRIPLGTQNPNPPATVPLWFFDESTGLWNEEGTATLQGAVPDQYYEGTVSHFSWWNADQPLLRTWVLGCVRDANGQPVANAWVESKGIDYTGSDWDWTASDGTFRVGVRRGSSATIRVAGWSFNLFGTETLSNVVTVTSSPNDPPDFERTLPNCLVVTPGVLTITTQVLPGGNVGTAYNQTLAASGGIPAYLWSLNVGSNPLPAGLSLDASGIISGTPTTEGTSVITVRVTDSIGGIATKDFSIVISPAGVIPLSITTLSPLPTGIVGSPYNFTLAATGGTGTKTWSVSSGTLPTGVTLNPSTGAISGTPTASGTATFTIQVQDSGNPIQSDQKQFSLTINSISGGGGSGQLSVSNAPVSVGGTFVVDPSLTFAYTYQILNPPVGATAIVWGEGWSANSSHWEYVGIGYTTQTSQLDTLSVYFVTVDNATSNPIATSWVCTDSISFCGITLNTVTRTVTFNNSVLTDVLSNAPAVTLNGTLTYPDPSTILQP